MRPDLCTLVEFQEKMRKSDRAGGKMKYSTKDLIKRVIGTCTGIVEEFILEICMMLTISSVMCELLMILLGKEAEDGLGVELLIPIVVMIHWLRNPRGK